MAAISFGSASVLVLAVCAATAHALGTGSAPSRGIAVSLSELVRNGRLQPWAFKEQLAGLRALGCKLPVEIWEAGNELNTTRQWLLELGGVQLRDMADHVEDFEQWRGWQLKGAIPSFTAFDELILIDADISFAINPEVLFRTAEWTQTGTYFFRDEQSKWHWFAGERCKSCNDHRFYRSRKKWVQGLLGPTMPKTVPQEWAYHWQEKTVNNATKEIMDSGVVLIDRRRHPGLIKHLFELNRNKAETYKYVWGDKETFWLSAVLADEPYALHPVQGTHECCSLLCYASMAHSYQWRHRTQRNPTGEAVRGSHLRGLVQRWPNGSAIYYHRKSTDVPPLTPWVLDNNARLCASGWGIAEEKDTLPGGQGPGVKLNSRLAHVVDRRFHLYRIAIGLLLLLCCCYWLPLFHLLHALLLRAEQFILTKVHDPNAMEPLLSQRRRAEWLAANDGADDDDNAASPGANLCPQTGTDSRSDELPDE
ncbi:mannosyltransferase putative-domain-containing protein [Pavlovales sp. CCMP2436]|nr:mannosyltransferase putative-domain-containing protein [Pavlovales sp. CCMP2436]